MLDRGHVKKNIYVILYVDDIVIICGDLNVLEKFKQTLAQKFQMRDLKEIRWFLGIRISKQSNKVSLDQSAYINELLRKYNMQDCNSHQTPIPSNLNWEGLNSDEPCEYNCQSLLDSFMYLMLCTRPDLSFAINIISRFVGKNNITVWNYLWGTLRYLKGTEDLKLVYERNPHDKVRLFTGYADSDYANNVIDRRSTTGYVFKMFDNCCITWSTKKQNSVASSSTEAEYMALFEAVREAKWLKSLAESINLKVCKTLIYEDNMGCISIAGNSVNHNRTKHIDVRYHFVRERLEDGTIELKHIDTKNQLADTLTKPLTEEKFLNSRDNFGLYY